MEERTEWNSFVKSFPDWDVYYLHEYANSLYIHGDGVPKLITYEDVNCRICYVIMESDLSDSKLFQGQLTSGECVDWECPYGYGGPLVDGSLEGDSLKDFVSALSNYCKEHRVVSQFIRFEPLLRNFEAMPELIETRYLRDTIYMDTSDLDLIWSNLDSKNRNMIRKAQKSGVEIECCPITDIDDFIDIYNVTMNKNNASEYYYFERSYFESLSEMSDNICLFYALLDGKRIAGSIIMYNERFVHYHLSGSYPEYRNVAPTNLLLYEVACWANEYKQKAFHLGGGMNPEDSLFGFKKQFNKNGRAPFVVGRTIFDSDKYEKLLDLRVKSNPEFDRENGFMIQYRR